jgi:AcrR family transcriptional regulator
MEISKDDARNRLLTAALNLFVSKGYAATSVSMIVQEAKVTKPMLYYYFKNKAGIYTEIMNEAFVEFEEIMERYPTSDIPAKDTILMMFRELLNVQEQKVEYVRLIHAMVYGPPQGAPHIDFEELHIRMANKVATMLKTGIEKGELEDMGIEDFTTILLSVLFFCFDTRVIECSIKMSVDDMQRLINKIFDKVLIKN